MHFESVLLSFSSILSMIVFDRVCFEKEREYIEDCDCGDDVEIGLSLSCCTLPSRPAAVEKKIGTGVVGWVGSCTDNDDEDEKDEDDKGDG